MSASRFKPETLKRIRESLSLVEVVGKSVTLKRKGRDWWACCPFHNEKTSSFHVREDEGYYHCFGCGAHGNIFDFVKETRGGSFPETVEYLASQAGVPLEREQVNPEEARRRRGGQEALERACVFYERSLSEQALTYLKIKRGLSDETIKTFRLGWAPKGQLKPALLQEGFDEDILTAAGLVMKSDYGDGDYERFADRVMFPIEDTRDQVVGFGGRVLGAGEPKYLNSSETEFFNKSRLLYNLNRAREAIRASGTALVVEGYMDVVGLWQSGVKNAVAPMGTAITPEQVRLLWRFCDAPVLCLDGDEAGRNAAVRLARKVLPILEPGRTVRFVWLPDGEDPDSFVAAHGRESFEALLKKPVSLDDVIWGDISLGHNLSSGDGRAAVDGAIVRVVKEIQDSTVGRHYQHALKDRLWNTVRRGRGKLSAKVTGPAIPSGVQRGKQARFLLSILLRYPELMEKFQEKFAEISFEQQEDKLIQDALFKLLSEKRLAKASVASYLDSVGLAETATKICETTLVDILVTAEQAPAVWEQVWREIHTKEERTQARRKALEAWTANPSKESWEKLRSVAGGGGQKAQLLEGCE